MWQVNYMIDVSFNSNEISYNKKIDATYMDDRIIYIEDDVECIFYFDGKIKRTSSEYEILIDFVNNIYKCHLVEGIDIDIPFKVLKYKNEKNFFEVEYYIENNSENIISYKIKYNEK